MDNLKVKNKCITVTDIGLFIINLMALIALVVVMLVSPYEVKSSEVVRVANDVGDITDFTLFDTLLNSSLGSTLDVYEPKPESIKEKEDENAVVKLDFTVQSCDHFLQQQAFITLAKLGLGNATTDYDFTACPVKNMDANLGCIPLLTPCCVTYVCDGELIVKNGEKAKNTKEFVQSNILFGLAIDIPVTVMDFIAILVEYVVLPKLEGKK